MAILYKKKDVVRTRPHDTHARERRALEQEIRHLQSLIDSPFEENKWVEKRALEVCKQKLKSLG